ncbi:unnamed protein product [Vicia faba]|uniref:Uncharacterized protein n=1 Tax=Vicia faba TaxID=3906 RepID=A0AAV0YS46_VICFA|nr:unnamed protein product [Vicia faba]
MHNCYLSLNLHLKISITFLCRTSITIIILHCNFILQQPLVVPQSSSSLPLCSTTSILDLHPPFFAIATSSSISHIRSSNTHHKTHKKKSYRQNRRIEEAKGRVKHLSSMSSLGTHFPYRGTTLKSSIGFTLHSFLLDCTRFVFSDLCSLHQSSNSRV